MAQQGEVVPAGAGAQPIPTPIQMMIIDPLLIEHISTYRGQVVNLRIEIEEVKRQFSVSKKDEKHWEDSYKSILEQFTSLQDKNKELIEENRAFTRKNKRLLSRNKELEASKILLDKLTERISRGKRGRQK